MKKKKIIIEWLSIIIVILFLGLVKDNISVNIPINDLQRILVGIFVICVFLVLTEKKQKIYVYWPLVLAGCIIFFCL